MAKMLKRFWARFCALGAWLLSDETGALVFDLVDTQELLGFVRGVVLEEERNRFQLAAFLPNTNVDDIEYRFTTGDVLDQDAALIRAWDAESPIGGRQGIRRILGELPPISKKIRLGEEERLRLRSLERGNNALIVDALFNDARLMARAVAARIELLRGEALYTGKLTINENGVNQVVDFNRDAGNTVSAATVWSNTAAEIVQEVRGWVDDYTDLNGVEPGVALTSTTVLSNMLRNDEIRALAGLGNVAGVPALVNEAAVRNVFTAFGLPPIVTYDVTVRVGGVATRVIPSDRFLLLPPAGVPMGGTVFGLTAEALALTEARQIGADQAPGVVAVVENTFDPVATWTKAAATALPILGDANLTFAADVL